MKFFQKLLVFPATAAFALAPNLNGFAKESVKTAQDQQQTTQNNWLISQVDDEQNKDNVSNSKLKSVFQFTYTDILGKIRCYNYYLNKSFEGDMLFFPSKLNHQVYPFYNCDDSRISVSGNILVKVGK